MDDDDRYEYKEAAERAEDYMDQIRERISTLESVVNFDPKVFSGDRRLSRDEMFMAIARVIALRGTCKRKRVGAILVRENRIISLGYVGSPPGEPHCLDAGCEIGPDGGCIRTIHAERNAIEWAVNHQIDVDGATMYTTMLPCLNCATVIKFAGIASVIYDEDYRVKDGEELLHQAGIPIKRFGN